MSINNTTHRNILFMTKMSDIVTKSRITVITQRFGSNVLGLSYFQECMNLFILRKYQIRHWKQTYLFVRNINTPDKRTVILTVCRTAQNISVIQKNLIYCDYVVLFTRFYDGLTVNSSVTCYTWTFATILFRNI